MNSTLELNTKLSLKSEHASLYKWFLQEYQPDGKQVGGPLIPWPWSLSFKAKAPKYGFQLRKENYFKTSEIEEQQYIGCELESVSGEFERPVSFSLFGTRRRVEHISLEISRMSDGQKGNEVCNVGATSQWEWKDDFSSRSTKHPDTIFITVNINPERFDRILHIITVSREIELGIMMGDVSGFYSAWSPDIKTSFIKVLTDQKDQKPEIPPECEIEPPTVGAVGRFNLSLGATLR